MRLCKDCVHFHPGSSYTPPYCTGPHIYDDIVYGKPRMNLPNARYSGGKGLKRGVEPCGEHAASHWQPRKPEVSRFSLWRWLLGKKQA